MKQVLLYLAIFFLLMNLTAGVMMSSGVGETIGIETDVGGDEKVEQSVNQAGGFSAGQGGPVVNTLFAMYYALTNALGTITVPVTAGPQMLARAGVPGVIAYGMLQPVIIVIYAVGLLSFMRGA
jgi:hypothetical protein